MATIHQTTLTPGKLELLTAWLPGQPWYAGDGVPRLAKAGGFRLDDPAGEVGIEFMIVCDSAGDRSVYYLAPVTYRGRPLSGADAALLGTPEHGVLGRRWVYDGVHDPVLVDQLLALVQGLVPAQAQSQSDTPESTVSVRAASGSRLGVLGAAVRDGGSATFVDVRVEDPAAARDGLVTLEVRRIIEPSESKPAPAPGTGYVDGSWTGPDGTDHRGRLVTIVASN